MSSIIESLREYIGTCPELEEGALLKVNSLGTEPVQYSIVPQPGQRIVETYLNDTEVCVYPFALQSMESTADDLERLESSAFYERLVAWMKEQSRTGALPVLPSKHTAKDIRAKGWAYLYEQGVSDTGVYQIQCELEYELEP